jgi:uncharacterized protein YciI
MQLERWNMSKSNRGWKNWLLWAVAALVSCGTLGAARLTADEARPLRDYWVFLVTGKSAAGVPRDEIQQKQKSHIENFGRLAGLKRLTIAGPMADPQKTLRGIVVVHAVDTNELAEHFVPDPYVSEGFMKVQANEIVHKQGAIALVGSESMLEELRIVVWNRDTAEPGKSAISEADRLAHRNYWQELIKAGQAGVVCEFAADAPRFGVAVMKKEDDEKIRLLLDTDPLVKARLIEYQVMPQFLAKGAVPFSKM